MHEGSNGLAFSTVGMDLGSSRVVLDGFGGPRGSFNQRQTEATADPLQSSKGQQKAAQFELGELSCVGYVQLGELSCVSWMTCVV